MKNYLKMTLVVAMTIPMLLSLSSCGNDDEQDEQKKETTYKAGFELTYKAVGELLSVADITVSYYDENGELRSEPITKPEWKKEITYKKIPANAGFKIICTIKNPLPDKDKFDIGYEYDGSVNLLKEKTDESVTSRALIGKNSAKGAKRDAIGKFLKTYEVNKFYQIKDIDIIEKPE